MRNILKAFQRHREPEQQDQGPKLRIGVCALDKKARSKQMQEILSRLLAHGEFEAVIFGDSVIFNEPVDRWPECDCLLSWQSEGFPLQKAQDYVTLRRPFLVNDVFLQDVLLDRRKVYEVLVENNIPVPTHIVADREAADGSDPPGFVEEEDFVELGGQRIYKPFVEKPASGENHNIYIYYPHSMGGGVKRLFRKVENKSSAYDPSHPGHVRRDGSYIYEEFLPTGGTDVKVYTVGPRYAHAEARKSPVVDGKVLRTADGKELRFPVLLNPQEKEIARMVSLAFGQKVCGFDLLRSEKEGKSYVCDVNGWSFVKNSKKYYDDAAGILRSIILSALAPHRLASGPILDTAALSGSGVGMGNNYQLSPEQFDEPDLELLEQAGGILGVSELPAGLDESEAKRTDERSRKEELRCVLAVVRHGDRTPKQKMKVKVTQPQLLELFHRHKDSKGKQAKLKSPIQLQELLDITRSLLQELEQARDASANGGARAAGGSEEQDQRDEFRERFRIVRTVLEQGGHFSGINRKVQLKPLKWEVGIDGHAPVLTEALLILKYGGILTHAGRQQAEDLGRIFRLVMYPRYGSAGGGLLRLHSTYRHDLKIYSSDEGRVQTSAAAFTKGLLDLEGDSLTPILVSLVHKDASMLDAFGKGASDDIRDAKNKLYEAMTWDEERSKASFTPLHPVTPPVLSPTGSPRTASRSSSTGSGLALLINSIQPSAGSSPQGPIGTRLSASAGMLAEAAAAEGSASQDAVQSGVDGASPLGLLARMPERPLEQLQRLKDLMRVVVEQLKELCRKEVDTSSDRRARFSSLSQSQQEWQLVDGQPCGGERLLLVFDRWQKLQRSFFSEKRQQFDISKVPDIYDSAKFDIIHNSHLGLDLAPLYTTAKALADCVIPSEYGLDPRGRLRIGSKICSELLGKLLADLESMRQESIATMGAMDISLDALDTDVGRAALDDEQMMNVNVQPDTDGVVDAEPFSHQPPEMMHRLCPMYASDINSPLRHVRTRIYFTSESHMHSLLNVLRWCHTRGGRSSTPLVRPEAAEALAATPELDYLTHIVFRMYEDKGVPVDAPERFRVEVLFSAGAAYSPLEVVSRHRDHVLPTRPRVQLHSGDGVTLACMRAQLAPLAVTHRFVPTSYALQVGLKAPSITTPKRPAPFTPLLTTEESAEAASTPKLVSGGAAVGAGAGTDLLQSSSNSLQ